jgi:hypothetical protein
MQLMLYLDVDTLDNNMGSGDEGVLVVLTSVTDIAAVDVVTLLRVLIWWFDEKRN